MNNLGSTVKACLAHFVLDHANTAYKAYQVAQEQFVKCV